jgi:hypothetical protein
LIDKHPFVEICTTIRVFSDNSYLLKEPVFRCPVDIL